jgi:hypothetical protein
MFKLKNIADYPLYLRQAGALTAANEVDAVIIPDDGYIDAVLCRSGVIAVAGGAADGLIDVNLNGTTVLATTKITFDHTTASKTPSYGDFVGLAPIAVSKGDVLSIDVDQTFNGGTAPMNVTLAFRFRRKTSPLAAMLTDSLMS